MIDLCVLIQMRLERVSFDRGRPVRSGRSFFRYPLPRKDVRRIRLDGSSPRTRAERVPDTTCPFCTTRRRIRVVVASCRHPDPCPRPSSRERTIRPTTRPKRRWMERHRPHRNRDAGPEPCIPRIHPCARTTWPEPARRPRRSATGRWTERDPWRRPDTCA